MFDEAYKIFDHLPVEQGAEKQYLIYLWDTFTTLEEKDSDVKYFSIVPFHLLFMMAVQYKVYRLAGYNKEQYISMAERCHVYGKENKYPVVNNIPLNDSDVWDASKGSVKTFALVSEKSLFDFFDIIGMGEKFKQKAYSLIDNRNDRFHANGEIDELVEEKISQYMQILNHIQDLFKSLYVNEHIQGSWADDVEIGEYPLDEFISEKFLYSQFSPIDFGEILFGILKSENLDFEQWLQFAEKGIELCPDQTQGVLKMILLQEDISDEIQFNAQKILDENF